MTGSTGEVVGVGGDPADLGIGDPDRRMSLDELPNTSSSR